MRVEKAGVMDNGQANTEVVGMGRVTILRTVAR